MALNKVVLKLRDGTIQKGQTNDFFPNKKKFHIEDLEGNIIEVSTDQLKAIFFVKDFLGDKNYEECYDDIIIGGGRKIEVLFPDGETVIGYTQGYSEQRIGFFITPADKDCNNERIFVVNASTKKVSFKT